MKVTIAVDTINDWCLAITRRVAFAGVIAMLAIALITTADVLLRWLANAPINGLNEIVGMGMAVAVAATLPAGASQHVNLTIDLLQNHVGDRVLAWLKVFGALSCSCSRAARLADRVYAQKRRRAAETIFVQLPTAPFVWTIAAFVAMWRWSNRALFMSVRNVRCRWPKRMEHRPATDAPREWANDQRRQPARFRSGIAIIAGAAIALWAI